jgi:hypothetical protein
MQTLRKKFSLLALLIVCIGLVSVPASISANDIGMMTVNIYGNEGILGDFIVTLVDQSGTPLDSFYSPYFGIADFAPIPLDTPVTILVEEPIREYGDEYGDPVIGKRKLGYWHGDSQPLNIDLSTATFITFTEDDFFKEISIRVLNYAYIHVWRDDGDYPVGVYDAATGLLLSYWCVTSANSGVPTLIMVGDPVYLGSVDDNNAPQTLGTPCNDNDTQEFWWKDADTIAAATPIDVSKQYIYNFGLTDKFELDEDGDGIVPHFEKNAPNNGDGNEDGIPDVDQNHVASYPSPETGDYVTVVFDEAIEGNVLAYSTNSEYYMNGVGLPFVGVQFPIGMLHIDAKELQLGQSITVEIILHSGATPTSYWKNTRINPNPAQAGIDNNWYEFLYDGTTGAEINGNRITLHLKDGERGDNDGLVNGIIRDPGLAIDADAPPNTKIVVVKNIIGDATGTFNICVGNTCQEFNGEDTKTFNVAPGTYTVTEQNPGDDWIASASQQVTVAEGETKNVTVTNTYVPPQGKIVIIKDVADGTDAQDFAFNAYDLGAQSLLTSFTLDDDADNALSNTWSQDVKPGNYAISETPVPDWLVNIQCQSAKQGAVGTITIDQNTQGKGIAVAVADDETVTCTFKNTYAPQPSYIRVTKDIVGAATGIFTICVDDVCKEFNGEETKTFEVAPGTYTVNEQDAGPDWTEPASQEVIVAAGETKEVTVINQYTPRPSYIRVTKDIVGDANGTFSICVNNDCRQFNGEGTQTFEVAAGTYTVSEQDAGPNWTEPAAQQVTVAEGETKDVTVVNTYVPPVLCPSLDPYAHLSAVIEPTGNPYEWQALVTNNSNCLYDVGFAAYEKLDADNANQILYNGNTILQIPSGITIFLIEAPTCATQLDVFFDASHLGVYNTYAGQQAALDLVPLVLPKFATGLYGPYGNWYGARLLAFKHIHAPFCVQQSAEPVAVQEPVVEEPVVLDDDQDGVNNDIDACPATAAGIAVDAAGCEIPAAPQSAEVPADVPAQEPAAPVEVPAAVPAESTQEASNG